MFAISTEGVPCIHSYAQAKQRYDSIKPIRGNSNNLRPIGPRSKQHMQIVEGRNTHGHYYAAALHTTERVRWYEGGKIQVRSGTWSTLSTSCFIQAVSPFRSHIGHNHLWVDMTAMKDGETGLWFERSAADGVGGWQCTNPPKYYINKLNKEVTRQIRAIPAIVLMQNYLKTMHALGAYEGRQSVWNKPTHAREMLTRIVTAMQQDPNYEPPLEVLARLGDAALGPMSWGVVYHVVAVMNAIPPDTLHDKHYITENVCRKGVRCE